MKICDIAMLEEKSMPLVPEGSSAKTPALNPIHLQNLKKTFLTKVKQKLKIKPETIDKLFEQSQVDKLEDDQSMQSWQGRTVG